MSEEEGGGLQGFSFKKRSENDGARQREEKERRKQEEAAATTSSPPASSLPPAAAAQGPPSTPSEEEAAARLSTLTWPALEDAAMRQLATTTVADGDTPLDDKYPFRLGDVAVTTPWATQWAQGSRGRRLSGKGIGLLLPAAIPRRRDKSASSAALEQLTWKNLLAPIFSKTQKDNPACIIVTAVNIASQLGSPLPSTEQAHTLLLLVDTKVPPRRFRVFLIHFAEKDSTTITNTIMGETLLSKNLNPSDIPAMTFPNTRSDAARLGLAATDIWRTLHTIVSALFVNLPEQDALPVQLYCCKPTAIPLEKRLLALVTYLAGSTEFMSRILLAQTTAALEATVARLVSDDATQWTRSKDGSIKHAPYWRHVCTVATLMPDLPGLALLVPTQSFSPTPSLDVLIDKWFSSQPSSRDLPERTNRTAVLAALWLDKLAEVATAQGACFGLPGQRAASPPQHQQKLAGEVAGLIAVLKNCATTANREQGATFMTSLSAEQLREAEDTASWLARVTVKLTLFNMPLEEKQALICRTALTLDPHQYQLFFFLCTQIAAEQLAQAEAQNNILRRSIADIARARNNIAESGKRLAALQPQAQAQAAIEEAQRKGNDPPVSATNTFNATAMAKEKKTVEQADDIVCKMQTLLIKLKEVIGTTHDHPLALFVTALTDINIAQIRAQLMIQSIGSAASRKTAPEEDNTPNGSAEIKALRTAIASIAPDSIVQKLVIAKYELLTLNTQLRELIQLQETIRQDDPTIQCWQTWYRAFQKETFDASLPSGTTVLPGSPLSVTTKKTGEGGYAVTHGDVKKYVLQGEWRVFVHLIEKEIHRKYQVSAWQRFANSVPRTNSAGFGTNASALVFSEVVSNPPSLTQEAAEGTWRTCLQGSSQWQSSVTVTAILPCYDSLEGHRNIDEPVWAWMITVMPHTPASSVSACLIICGTQAHYTHFPSWQMKFNGFAIKDEVNFTAQDNSHGGLEEHSFCSVYGTLARALGKVLSEDKHLNVPTEDSFAFVLPVCFLYAPEPDAFCNTLGSYLATSSTLHQSLSTPEAFEALQKALQSRLSH